MDSQAKTGKAYLRPRKAGKKWKPVWLSLVAPSSNGVGRLEIQHIGGGATGGEHGTGLRRHHQPHERQVKVVRLTELISVLRLPPNAEACPMENMSAFCVETQERTMVFAAHKDDCLEWVEKLCRNTFQKNPKTNQLHMEENQIYATADDASDFWVVVQRTDAAIRCGLQGSYWLQVGQKTLLLKDTQKIKVVRQWPYELLRRYGNDKMVLTIEAGRRCDSGPGTFTFETQQAEKIFNLIQSTIKQKTLAVASGSHPQKEDTVLVTNLQTNSPLPKTPEMSSMDSILETGGTPVNISLVSEDTVGCQDDSAHSSESPSPQPAPITLMPLPVVPKLDKPPVGVHCYQSEAEYANPNDCILTLPKPQATKSLYVDPASILPLCPPSSQALKPPSFSPHPCFVISHPDTVYSEVYDKVRPGQNEPHASLSQGNMMHLPEDEPIYAEPVSKEDEIAHKDVSKPDPFAHLYAQVNKTPPSSSPSSTTSTPSFSSASSLASSMATIKMAENTLDDVIYENLGLI
ncbi:docking protein 1 [Dunckerocampus dactyliophorus]|uniref:docking protein 1 n=1 Tax=Dunckerocampus dactyliophorus TaxID=161453 RepID=UPI002406ECDA|nr:docking protein 1 [Dunckerocampus dactyliophorus]